LQNKVRLSRINSPQKWSDQGCCRSLLLRSFDFEKSWSIKCSSYLLLSVMWTPLNLHIAWELKIYILFLKTHLWADLS